MRGQRNGKYCVFPSLMTMTFHNLTMRCQGSSECFLYPLAEFKEPTSKGREGKGTGGVGKGRRGIERGRVQMKAEGNRGNKSPTTMEGEGRGGKGVGRAEWREGRGRDLLEQCQTES